MKFAILEALKSTASECKGEIPALYLAIRDPRTPWHAKALAAAIVVYALSPIDLIPDVIPILGHLDDLVLLPLGILVVLKTIPAGVMADCRAKAAAKKRQLPRNWPAAVAIVVLWLLAATLVARFLLASLVGDVDWDARFGY